MRVYASSGASFLAQHFGGHYSWADMVLELAAIPNAAHRHQGLSMTYTATRMSVRQFQKVGHPDDSDAEQQDDYTTTRGATPIFRNLIIEP